MYDELRERIRNGIYVPGSKLPSDEELCEEFGVSAITLKKALEMVHCKEAQVLPWHQDTPCDTANIVGADLGIHRHTGGGLSLIHI